MHNARKASMNHQPKGASLSGSIAPASTESRQRKPTRESVGGGLPIAYPPDENRFVLPVRAGVLVVVLGGDRGGVPRQLTSTDRFKVVVVRDEVVLVIVQQGGVASRKRDGDAFSFVIGLDDLDTSSHLVSAQPAIGAGEPSECLVDLISSVLARIVGIADLEC